MKHAILRSIEFLIIAASLVLFTQACKHGVLALSAYRSFMSGDFTAMTSELQEMGTSEAEDDVLEELKKDSALEKMFKELGV